MPNLIDWAKAHPRLAAWIAVDAFPGTPFLEAVSLWERSVGARNG